MSLPVVATAGNHDEYALNEEDEKLLTKFNEHERTKRNDAVNGGSYYSFDYNGAHMVVANTNDNKNLKTIQMKKQLAKNKWNGLRKTSKST